MALARLVSLCLLLLTLITWGCSHSPEANSSGNSENALEVLSAADETLKRGGELEADFIESVLKIETDDQDTLVWLARDAHRMGQSLYHDDRAADSIPLYLKAGAALRKAEQGGLKLEKKAKAKMGAIYYDEACALSLSEKPEPALRSLQRSLDLGFGDVDFFELDDDLAAVRALPTYAAFKEKALAEMKAKIAEELKTFESYPFSFEVETFSGEQLALTDLRGKVVALDLWATWCQPCLMTIPHLVEIYEEHQDQGLVILGLNSEGETGDKVLAHVKQTIAEMKIPYPNALLANETARQIPGLRGLPTMVFLDRAGKVRYQTTGAHSKEFLMAVLKPLLEETPPAETTSAEDPLAETEE